MSLDNSVPTPGEKPVQGVITPEPKPVDTAPPKTPPAQPDAVAVTPSMENRVEFGDVSHSKVTLKQEFTLKSDFLDSGFSGWRSMFSWTEAELVVTGSLEKESSNHFICDEAFVESTVSILNRHRIVLLMGEADCGKNSMARYLAARLRTGQALRHDTIVYGPLRGDVILNLRATLIKEEKLHDRVVIFRDAVERANPGVTEFLSLLKGEAIEDVTNDLAGIGSYLILTAAPGTLPQSCQATLPGWLRPSVPPLTLELLARGIEECISRFLARDENSALKGVTASAELKQEIAQRSGTMSRAQRFIELHLVQVLRGEKTISRAFDEMDSLSSWFQRGPDTNLEAWLYCLALVLADPLNGNEGVPWAEFFMIHEAVRSRILDSRKIEKTERPFDEAGLHALVGVEIRRDPALARDLIAFRDPATAERLWNMLFKRFPSLLMELTPALLELAEHDTPAIRSKAVQALGRIGKLDAGTMSGPWMTNWSRSDAWWERSLVGYLAQGAMRAGDSDYRRFILTALDRYTQNPKQTWVAIAAYRQIGTINPDLGMDKLKEIARSRLAPAFESSRDIWQKLHQLGRDLTATKMLDADVVHAVVASLGSFYENLFKEDAQIARTFKYSLVSLSMNPGLTPVLARLSRWALSEPGMGALVSLVFLQQEGIAGVLTERKLTLVLNPGTMEEQKSCCMILASLVDSPDAIGIFVGFMQTMCTSILDFFPPDTATILFRLFFGYCKKWVIEALPIPPCRDAMIEVIGRFLQSPLKELYERTYDWLASDPDFGKPEMVAFAKSVRLFNMKTRL